MNPNSAKRPRRSSSGSHGSSASRVRLPPPQSSPASPSHPILPAPVPSGHTGSGPPYQQYGPPPGVPGPSAWQSTWPPREYPSRRSIDARSPSSSSSPRAEGPGEPDEMGGMVFARDVTNRAPRSMMACTRCRRQKMKCDGPSQVPCRGCRASGQPCIFEARSRPKSISVIPARPPPFFAGALGQRPPTPSSTSGFYPSGPQPAPPVTSRTPAPGQDLYAFRQAREPMPPPPASSINALTQPQYTHSPRTSSNVHPSGPSTYYNPPPLQLPPLQPASSQQSAPPRPSSPITQESRLRNVESTLRSFSSIPSTLSRLQSSISTLQRSQEQFVASISTSMQGSGYRREPRARETIFDLPESLWESYRSRAWPLTPWLVGLREHQGLPGAVVNYLGKRSLVDRSEASRRECEEAALAVSAEIGRLMADRIEWSREEIRALGIFATWSSDSILACLAVGLARRSGIDRIYSTKRSHDDWREWIYMTIMDQLCQIPDYNSPITSDTLGSAWRDRLSSTTASDPATRDRDLKLLAWLEYTETLVEVHHAQQVTRSNTNPSNPETETATEENPSEPLRSGSGGTGSATGEDQQFRERESDRKRATETWRKWATKWEAWAGGWSARSDPILSLHFNYAILYTASPAFLASPVVWGEMAQVHEGYQQLERARDAAFAVIQAVCSPEIGRTLPYSFALYRPLLGLAITHLVSLSATLPHSPIISLPHVQTVLRSIYEALSSAQPLDIPPIPGTASYGRPGTSGSGERRPGTSGVSTTESVGSGIHTVGSLLVEMVEGGQVVAVGKREIVGIELSRDFWKRLLG